MINLKLLYKIIGSLLFIETTMFLVCLGVAIGYEEEDIFRSLAQSLSLQASASRCVCLDASATTHYRVATPIS